MVSVFSGILIDILKYTMWEGILLYYFLSNLYRFKINIMNSIIFGLLYGVLINLTIIFMPPIIFQALTICACGVILSYIYNISLKYVICYMTLAFVIMLNVNVACAYVCMAITKTNVTNDSGICLLIVQYISYILTFLIYKLLFKFYKRRS